MAKTQQRQGAGTGACTLHACVVWCGVVWWYVEWRGECSDAGWCGPTHPKTLNLHPQTPKPYLQGPAHTLYLCLYLPPRTVDPYLQGPAGVGKVQGVATWRLSERGAGHKRCVFVCRRWGRKHAGSGGTAPNKPYVSPTEAISNPKRRVSPRITPHLTTHLTPQI